jgi:Mg-chelatase subunit ChlI
MAILERNLEFESDPEGFREEWEPREKQISSEIEQARTLISKVQHTQSDLATIASFMAGLGVDGHRADLVILKTARAHAAFQARTYITQDDILLAAELALPHRLKRGPFQDREMTSDDLAERLEQAESDASSAEQVLPTDQAPEPGGAKKKH